MGIVVPFKSKDANTPLHRWAQTIFYLKKTKGENEAKTWIKKHTPEQFHIVLLRFLERRKT